jgi:hypothetical protein
VGLPASVAEQRGESLAVLAALAVLYCTLLLAFLRLLKFFRTDDLDVLMRALPLNLQPLASARPVAFLFGERARDDRA